MENRLKEIKYPLEFPRSQRSLNDLKTFKANEFRNLLYLIPILFYDVLPSLFYQHALIYVTFIRTLTQPNLSKQDILYSQNLISAFSLKFKTLYGEELLTYKLHTHIHFPAQAYYYGPLNEISAFPFESIFKTYK